MSCCLALARQVVVLTTHNACFSCQPAFTSIPCNSSCSIPHHYFRTLCSCHFSHLCSFLPLAHCFQAISLPLFCLELLSLSVNCCCRHDFWMFSGSVWFEPRPRLLEWGGFSVLLSGFARLFLTLIICVGMLFLDSFGTGSHQC